MRPVGRAPELEKRRQRVVDAVERNGMSVARASEKYGVTERTIYKWLAAFRENGVAGIAQKRHEKTTAKLTAGQIRRLEKMLLSGSRKFGYKDDLWTCPRIVEIIKKFFGVEYHHTSIAKLLARMGWTPQRPAKRAIERDEAKIEKWAKTTWAQIKKKRETSERR